MPHDTPGLHHLHRRKRVYLNLEKYPNPNKWKRGMDFLIYVVAFVGPLMTLPQIFKIWIDKSSESLSLLTWGTYVLTSCLWLAYALMHKEKPLIASSVAWILVNALVFIGALIYA